MKSYKVIGLAVVFWGCSVMPSTAWVWGARGSTCANGNFGGARINARGGCFNACGRGFRQGFNGQNFDGRFGSRNGCFGRNNNWNDNSGFIFSGGYSGYDYNNANYLGYPPWYRLNYYAPWSSDYNNGTAGMNVPTSNAAAGYAYPGDIGGPTGPGGPGGPGMNLPGEITQAPAYADLVVGVQRELRRRGFYRGIVNGISDEATRAAIRAYESRMGLPVTGVIGIPLLKTLGFFQ